MTTTMGWEYRTPWLREAKAEGLAEGLAESEAREARARAESRAEAVLMVLGNRGVQVPGRARERIMSCRNLDQLDEWLGRALTATTIEDVIPKKS